MVQAGFNYVEFEDAQTIHVSVIPDRTLQLPSPLTQPLDCKNKVDLVFLLDGSGSIEPEDFEKAKEFVKDVVDYFDIGIDNTRVGLATFSGWLGEYLESNATLFSNLVLGHVSSISGFPDCPEGTHFEQNGLVDSAK